MMKPFKIFLPVLLVLSITLIVACSSLVIRQTGPTDTLYQVQLLQNGKNVQGWARIEYMDSTGTTVRLDSAAVSWSKTMISNSGDKLHLRAVNLSNCCKISVSIISRGVDIGKVSDSTGRGGVAEVDGTVSNQ